MKIRHLASLLLALTFSSPKVFASDTSYRKPTFISVSIAQTSSLVSGSMVDKTKAQEPTVAMRNNKSLAFSFRIQKQLSNTAFFATGLDCINKKVDPQQSTYIYYKDRLNTTYLSVPFLVGTYISPIETSKLNLSLECGPAVNIRVADKSYFGPDRAAAGSKGVTIALNAGVGASWSFASRCRLSLRYSYIADITKSYYENLYWGSYTEPIKYFAYNYKTNAFAAGLQFTLTSKRISRHPSEEAVSF